MAEDNEFQERHSKNLDTQDETGEGVSHDDQDDPNDLGSDAKDSVEPRALDAMPAGGESATNRTPMLSSGSEQVADEIGLDPGSPSDVKPNLEDEGTAPTKSWVPVLANSTLR